jgi:hypothetical protein
MPRIALPSAALPSVCILFCTLPAIDQSTVLGPTWPPRPHICRIVVSIWSIELHDSATARPSQKPDAITPQDARWRGPVGCSAQGTGKGASSSSFLGFRHPCIGTAVIRQPQRGRFIDGPVHSARVTLRIGDCANSSRPLLPRRTQRTGGAPFASRTILRGRNLFQFRFDACVH